MVCTLSGAALIAVFVFAIVAGIGFVLGSAIAGLILKK